MQEFTGLDYLKIDIAGSYGLDKKTWGERLAWFTQNENNLDSEKLIQEADSMPLYLAGLQAYKDVLNNLPTGYLVNLDATHSGLQMLSILTGDEDAAKLCNVVNDNNQRNDSYTIIYDIFKQIVPDAPNVERAEVKRAIMTSLYSSKREPMDLLGEEHYEVFCKIMEKTCPLCWTLNEICLQAWNPEALCYDWDMPDGFHVHFDVKEMVTEAVNFGGEKVLFNHIENKPVEQGRCLSANLTHSVDSLVAREMLGRCRYNFNKQELLTKIRKIKNSKANINIFGQNGHSQLKDYDPQKNKKLLRLLNLYKETGFFSVRVLDFLTETNIWAVPQKELEELVESLPDKPFDMIIIHDCYRVHPNYGNDVRRQYRNILQKVAESNLLDHIMSSILHQPVQGLKAKTLTVDGEYALS